MLRQGVAGVERHIGQRGLFSAEDAVDAFDRVFQQDSDPVAWRQTQANQGIGKAIAARFHIRMAETAILENQGGQFAMLGRRPGQHGAGNHASTTRTWPSLTASPSFTRSSVTIPAQGAWTGISIFMLSRMIKTWSASTLSPGLTSSLQTSPLISDSM